MRLRAFAEMTRKSPPADERVAQGRFPEGKYFNSPVVVQRADRQRQRQQVSYVASVGSGNWLGRGLLGLCEYGSPVPLLGGLAYVACYVACRRVANSSVASVAPPRFIRAPTAAAA